jgi:hypothetical protein
MVGKKEHTSSRDLASYHERHLAGSEYHLERGQVSGEFFGPLSERMAFGSASDIEGRYPLQGVREAGRTRAQ